MKPIPILLALLAPTASAAAQEGGPIRTGEHPGFSRIVMSIAPDTEWTLDVVDRTATINFPGHEIAFATDSVWERMGRERVSGITASQGPEGSEVRIDLACDCAVNASFVNGRYLAIDVHDPTEASASREPSPDAAALLLATAMEAARALRAREYEAAAFEAAERGLLAQIERAAGQGLVELTDQHESTGPEERASEPGEDAVPEEPPVSEHEAAAPRPLPRGAGAEESGPDFLSHLTLDAQIAAISVFDRDGAGRRAEAARADPRCQADAALDIARWSDGRPHTEQAAGLRHLLVGEFDRPDAAAVRALARLHIRHGLGAEARAVLDSFDADLPDRDLLADLARLVDGGEALGPLARDIICPGRHGLWLAIAGNPAMLTSDDAVRALPPVFAELPRDLRMLLGPRLITNLLETGRPEDARVILDVAQRSGETPTAPLALASGRVAAAEGRLAGAEAHLLPLVERRAHNSDDALLTLVAARLAAGEPVPEAWVTDLHALAFEQAGGPREVPARALAAEAEARNGNIRAAIAELASLAAGSAKGRGAAEALAPRLLAEAGTDAAGAAAFAEAMLRHPDLLAPAPEHDAHRLTIAAKLLDLGLATPAIEVLGPMLARGSGPARITAARAHIALGDGAAAEDLLDGLDGAEAEALRAKAAIYAGAASMTATEAGAPEGAQSHAAAADDGKRVPRPELALPVPLPDLEEPSLGAARSLLETGPQIRGFVNELLAGP